LVELEKYLFTLNNDVIVVFCQTGQRSNKAAEMIFEKYGGTKKIYSLKGGIVNWKQHRAIVK
jgi:adenylyltransferase/sulfurtransferase